MKRDLHFVGDFKIGVCFFGAFGRPELADGNGHVEMRPERQGFDGFAIAFGKDGSGGVSLVIDAGDLDLRGQRRAVSEGECDYGVSRKSGVVPFA